MKILVITQYYWPENSRVTDIAESLQKEGNEVTVLTGLPNYPQGYIYEGYKKGENRIQEHNGVHIVRAKLIERRRDTLHRLLNYYSFPHYASKLAKKLPDDFDVVLAVEESPIMLVKPAIVYAKKYKKPLIMYEMDLWPESLLAGGVTKKSFIYKHYKKVSAKIYSQFDKIIVSTKEHIPYIKELPGCKDLDIEYLAQYADTIFEESEFGGEDNGVVDLMFAGNIGKAQSVDTIIRAAALLKEKPGFKFHIVGSGSELENIKKLATELKTDNVAFYGQRPLEDMPGLYKIADLMLVTLEDKPYANMTIPGKVQTYMAVRKPIIGAINGSCANFIKNNNVGFACPSGDSESLANLIKNLNLKELQVIGEHSKNVYFDKYSKSIFMNKLISTLESMKK
ncbi:MAG: glycosyltransferase family 4 protein [Bacilli bacterium]|nr:glycosyltransferase family 4 protein [Bacilli bacterium]